MFRSDFPANRCVMYSVEERFLFDVISRADHLEKLFGSKGILLLKNKPKRKHLKLRRAENPIFAQVDKAEETISNDFSRPLTDNIEKTITPPHVIPFLPKPFSIIMLLNRKYTFSHLYNLNCGSRRNWNGERKMIWNWSVSFFFFVFKQKELFSEECFILIIFYIRNIIIKHWRCVLSLFSLARESCRNHSETLNYTEEYRGIRLISVLL